MNQTFGFQLRQAAKHALLALGLAATLPAQAAIFGDDEARNAIIDLRTKTQNDNQTLRNSLLELQRQIDALRQELAQSRGKAETLESDVLNLQKTLNSTNQRIQTAEQRVQTTEQRVQTTEQRIQKFEPISVEVDGEIVLVDPREKQNFEDIMARLEKNEYAAADIEIDLFLAKYPDSAYRAAALYWSGNSKFALKSYPKSIESFRKLLSLNPRHVRAPEAQLGIANAQVQLKDKKSAKKTLEDLVVNYPDTVSAEKAKELIPLMK